MSAFIKANSSQHTVGMECEITLVLLKYKAQSVIKFFGGFTQNIHIRFPVLKRVVLKPQMIFNHRHYATLDITNKSKKIFVSNTYRASHSFMPNNDCVLIFGQICCGVNHLMF